jgi:hypothetical protein
MKTRLAALLLVAAAPLGLIADEPAPKSPNAERVRRAVASIGRSAEANVRRLPRESGDALADRYIRDLADFCIKEKVPVDEYLMALGVGLDASDFLRRHPLSRGIFKDLDSDAERERRAPLLGQPTLRKRPDWLLHFALSAALTAATSPDAAELLGIAKELQDALGPSGFSFADLAADNAGIAFARHLLAHPERLTDVAKTFRGEDFLPAIGDLEEGLSMKSLKEKYGEPSNDQFRATCRAIRERMHAQAIYKNWTQAKKPDAQP